MKRVLWMVLLTMALPMAAFAGTIDFTSTGGTLTGGDSGLSMSGTTITTITGLTATQLNGGNFGTIAFTTGAFSMAGGAANGGAFAAGGTITITAENITGITNGTTIFSGTFTCKSGCTWTLMSPAGPGGNNIYVLAGSISGTWYTGATISGVEVQTAVTTGMALFDGNNAMGTSGDTTFTTTTPEPGSLMLMGTGLVGMAGALRRKLKA